MSQQRQSRDYVSMGCGAQCVTMAGMSKMLELCVDNLDMLEVGTTFGLLGFTYCSTFLIIYTSLSVSESRPVYH